MATNGRVVRLGQRTPAEGAIELVEHGRADGVQRRALLDAESRQCRDDVLALLLFRGKRAQQLAVLHDIVYIMTLVNKPPSIVLLGPKRHSREWP